MRQLFKFAAVAFAIVATASCAKEMAGPGPETDLETVTLTAEIDGSKAAVATDGKVLWQAGDKIAVWAGTTKYEMELVSGEGTTSALFQGEIPAGTEISAAAYPASQAGTEAGTVLPKTEQTIAAGATCDPEAVIMTAAAPVEGVVTFKNACGGVRITVAEGVSSMAIYYADGEVEVTLPGTAGTFDVLLPVADYGEALLVETTASAANGIVFGKGLTVTRNVIANLGTPELSPCTLIYDAQTLQAYLDAPETAGYIIEDIDLQGIEITPCESFGNVLDGLGHSLKNWTSEATPLFYVNAGTIKNLVIDSSCTLTTAASGASAFVAASNEGTITGCTSNGTVSISLTEDEAYIGAIAGKTSGSIADCTNTGAVGFDGIAVAKVLYVGGIAGQIARTAASTDILIENCKNEGDLSFAYSTKGANIYAGGIVGGTITAKLVSGTAQPNLGIISGCINEGDVSVIRAALGSGTYTNVAGIGGYLETSIASCINKGDIQYVTPKNNTGGNACTSAGVGSIVSRLMFSAKDCVNYGNVKIAGTYAAGTSLNPGTGASHQSLAGGMFGAVGHPNANNTTDCVDNCDNYGGFEADMTMLVDGGSAHYLGGIVGYCMLPVKNCDFYKSEGKDIVVNNFALSSYVGGVAAYAAAGASDCTCDIAMSVTYDLRAYPGTSTGYCRCGGVVGMASAKVSGCVCKSEIHAYFDNNGTKSSKVPALRIGGIVGDYNKANAVIQNCTFAQGGSLTVDHNYKLYVGGIVGSILYNYPTIEGCKNYAPMTVNCTYKGVGSVKQTWMGGIAGYVGDSEAGFTFKNCDNFAVLKMTGGANTAFNYIAGIYGTYGTGGTSDILENCTNSGNIISTSTNKMRIAGIAASHVGAITNCRNTGDVSMSNGAALSSCGGLVAYYGGGTMDNAYCKCAVDVQSDVTCFAGGLIGDSNGTNYLYDVELDAAVTSNQPNVGYIAGSFYKAAQKAVLGAEGKPFVLKATSTVNGVAVPSEPEDTDLFGTTAYADCVLTRTNFVIE